MSSNQICLTDPKLVAAATALGGSLEKISQDSASNKVVFHFAGLSATFLEDCFNNKLTIRLTPFLDALERTYALIAQYRAGRGSR